MPDTTSQFKASVRSPTSRPRSLPVRRSASTGARDRSAARDGTGSVIFGPTVTCGSGAGGSSAPGRGRGGGGGGAISMAAIVVLCLFFVGSAEAHVYWANNADTTIGRANLDGTGVNQSFIGGATSPCGVAVDGAHVYWGNSAPARSGAPTSTARARTRASSAARRPLRGGGRRARTSTGPTPTAAAIGRANLDGSGREPELHQRRRRALRGGGRRRARLLGATRRRHDRARQPRRQRA